MPFRTQLIPFLVLVVTIVFDQVTKILIVRAFQQGDILPVIDGFFSLTLHYNPGVAFGMFADWAEPGRTFILTGAKMFALGLCLFLLRKHYQHSLPGQIALALIIGGAIGNIIDRAHLGHVVDFLDFYVRDYHWPTFNIADSAICIGVVLLLFVPERKCAPQPKAG